MKRKRFLQLLEEKLSVLSEKEKQKIIRNYEKDIEKRVNNGEKETSVIRSYGKIDNLASKIIEESKNDKLALVISYIKSFVSKVLAWVKNVFVKLRNRLRSKKDNDEDTQKPVILDDDKVAINVRAKASEIRQDVLNMSLLNKIFGILLSFALVVNVIVFLILMIGFLDGTFVFGMAVLALCILLLMYICIRVWYKRICNKYIDYKKMFLMILIILIISGSSIALTGYTYYKYERVTDVTKYFTMYKEIKEFTLPSDENVKYYIDLNTIYKTNYRVSYDNSLDNEIKVEVNYFCEYYDLYFKTYRNSLYISFGRNLRNRLSTFLDSTREKRLYNYNELKRYTLTIYMNEKDKDRIVFNK